MSSKPQQESNNLESANIDGAIHWAKSVCPVCGTVYYHSEFYKPQTCLNKLCILKNKENSKS